jgi:hypothetical protein
MQSSWIRCLSLLTLLGLVVAGSTGCGESNDWMLKDQEAKSDTSAPAPKQARTMEDYAKQRQQQQQQNYSRSGGYPGARR